MADFPERRRWVDVWWAPGRAAAIARVSLNRHECVAAAFASDRKWCVLVVKHDPSIFMGSRLYVLPHEADLERRPDLHPAT